SDPQQVTATLGEGRLLIYYPDENLTDGAAPLASQRFFDDDNIPPWDIWLTYILDDVPQDKTYLIAWTPPDCLELAVDGIDVNPEQCICWAADVSTEFIDHLKNAGLLS